LPAAGAALSACARRRGATSRQDSASNADSSATRARASCTYVQPLRPQAPAAAENTFGLASRTIVWTSGGSFSVARVPSRDRLAKILPRTRKSGCSKCDFSSTAGNASASFRI